MIIAGVHCWGPEAKGFTAFLEPIGIFFAIMLASCVGFFFELKANKAFDVLNTVNDDTLVKVIREGNICQVTKKKSLSATSSYWKPERKFLPTVIYWKLYLCKSTNRH